MNLPKLKALFSIILCLLSFFSFAQPANDVCANASTVNIANNGYGIGSFSSAVVDISAASVQTGETFAPAILQSGQSQKSVWYKFVIPTTRAVRVTLAQQGTGINAGDVGFAVYKTNTCLPGNAQISTKLTPINVFGNTYHPCVDSGIYYVQVSSKSGASGQIYVTVETDYPTASYDRPAQAHKFGTLAQGTYTITYPVDCQSIEDDAEVCTALSNYTQYTKSSWHVFKTPAYFDYIVLMIAQQTGASNKIGYKIYEGDVSTAPYSSLPVKVACDSFVTANTYFTRKLFKCDQLDPNKTYSVQFFFPSSFEDNVKVGISVTGTTATQAPRPVLSSMPAPSNNMGTLPSNANGITTNTSDYFGCNSRHSVSNCGPAITTNGVKYAPYNFTYNLSSFFIFTLSSTSNVTINTSYVNCGGSYLYFRLFNQAPTNSCSSLDTTNIIGSYINYSGPVSCLPAGTYTLQVMGRDSSLPTNYYSYGSFNDGYSSYPTCYQTDLGTKFNLYINVKTINAQNDFSLVTPAAFDTINRVSGVMQAMVNNTTYTSKRDTFGCLNTILPADTTCYPSNTKAIYREMAVADSGVLSILNTNHHWYKLYRGDANALSSSQGINAYPGRIQGLTAMTNCLQYSSCDSRKVCVTPGTYTHVTFGADGNISEYNQPEFRFNKLVTTYGDPANPENMGDILAQIPAAGGSKASSIDYYSCKDNAVTINGFAPCSYWNRPATKAIYRQFYLSAPARVSLTGYHYGNCGYTTSGFMTLFSGKASDGLNTLTVMPDPWRCTNGVTANQCDLLPAGWYTVVSYGTGPNYTNSIPAADMYEDYVGRSSQITITVSQGCPGPKYNRPAKAAIDTLTGQPFLIEWKPRVGHTTAYPKTDTTYTLYRENFNCTVDTPFSAHPIPNCNSNLTKVAYYVFRTTQESYVQIDTKNFWAAVYAGNARSGTSGFDSSSMIQSCLQSYGKIQLCRLQPGTYTLAVFADNNQNCTNVEPTIYIDQVGYSRFDHASKAYDFGVIPSDSVWHNGKPGDVNPLNAGRAPSNDFFYCTTGAQKNDPTDPACSYDYLPGIYDPGVNNALYNTQTGGPNASWVYNIPRRNLWYTFVADKGGYVRIRVTNKTIGKQYQYRFAVYKSNEDGTLPFSTLVSSGAVDSTVAQGLTHVANNNSYYYCFTGPGEISFYREPCSPTPERYYILVENTNSYPYDMIGMRPNNQVEVSVLMDSINAIQPKFDHYSTAGDFGSNLGAGTYTGPTDNYSCATKDVKDPVNSPYGNYSYCANKTLWYKFTTNVTGKIGWRVKINNSYQYGSYYDQIMLFRQNIAGDSTTAGLQHIAINYAATVYDNVAQTNWYRSCLTPGTYYILLPGCNRVNEYVYPEIQIEEEKGDFCSAPVVSSLTGPGTKVSAVTIDCHTIGTDYGEFNTTLTCPNGASRSNYKTSWFRLDISGSDTLDVTTYLTENTTATSSQIKYRMMDGNCGAMQERSCVQDALTQDTYKCLLPGKSYFFQVFTPVSATGTINLNLSAVKHADTCATEKNCLSTAVFIPQYDCTQNDTVRFTNLSTYGSGIQYQWDFGYGGQTSTQITPSIAFPVLATSQTYTVKLKVTNTGCTAGSINVDSTSQQITIPGRPKVNLGHDTTLCTYGSSLKLDATTWSGTTYQWSTGATTPTINITSGGVGTYWVQASYNGCIKKDTITVGINPINKLKQTTYLCGNDSVQLSSYRGYGESHLWNTGSTNYYIYASTGGLYQNQVGWQGCAITDSFTIIQAQEPFAKADTTICYPFKAFSLSAATPGATQYQWQNCCGGSTFNVTAPGTYVVQVYNGTCWKKDTVKVLTTAAPLDTLTTAAICGGGNYTLPWGKVVNTSGIYSDTIRYALGCDSLVRSVSLTVTPITRIATSPVICSGQSYTLPWAQTVTAAGVYSDTLRSQSGCDSLIRQVTLSIAAPTQTTNTISICQGTNYTLPWGPVVTNSGVYSDTLRYSAGCDSLIRTVNLTVLPRITSVTNATICSGVTYALPWGTLVNTSGIYRDTLRYTTGCDSVIRIVNLVVNAPVASTTTVSICADQTYTLPWGAVVSAAGTYRDTLRYTTGCDSVVRSVTLSVRAVSSTITNAVICGGQSYTLPSGLSVTTAGTYRDTLRYAAGCDSIIRITNLTVKAATVQNNTVTICPGQNYTLPWGRTVNATGTYRDTLRYANGCDSVQQTVNLIVLQTRHSNNTITICSGTNYQLPWGRVVATPGIYKDTLRFTGTGCDSLIRTIDLRVQTPATQRTTATICQGANYVLPWGAQATTAGVYSDTLHYQITGCDSLIRTVTLAVLAVTDITDKVTICSGGRYTLPWGPTVTVAGTYSDTLRYTTTGCDSVRRSVTVFVTAPQNRTTTASICDNEQYTLPWGRVVTTTGIYRDTLRTALGCDSLVQVVNLVVNPMPVMTLTKSNDVDCGLGTAKLLASGGTKYVWWPDSSLNNAFTYSPVASPTTATLYHVKVTTDRDCSVEDSIMVYVNVGNAEQGYYVPNSFTPNGDGQNDCFGVKHWGAVTDLHFTIYNRWGKSVFSTTDVQKCWDGSYKGEEQRTEVFVYIITAKTICGPILRKGTVTLIR